MIKFIKKILYFPIAYYFRFWAQIQLSFWRPVIVVVTGSSGKTTLLHLLESQIGNKAKFSHHANSAYGISFDILGLTRKNLTPDEWIFLFLLVPFKAFKRPFKEKLYVVEADCDRPGEGKFLASLLKPDYLLWVSSSLTHTANFDCLVKNNSFPNAENAIAYEFGYFLEYTRKLAIVNADSNLIKKQLPRTTAPIVPISQTSLKSYKIFNNRTEFVIEDKKYSINFLVPKSVFYSISMTITLINILAKVDPSFKVDPWFSKFNPPPGRSSFFKGIKNITIIDSTYNATPDGVRTILEMFKEYPARNKWVVLGDMIELGEEEKKEHEEVGKLLLGMKLEKIILIGPRVSKYIDPIVPTAQTFLMPKDALDYILKNIHGEETMLFKGARFLEGIIEHLLLDKNGVKKLVRREKVWENRRKGWEL